MNQFGCPYSKDPNSRRSGTGGPDPNTSFQGCDGKMHTRNEDGGIPDENIARISNGPGTLSMANTGSPESGGSQFFINVASKFFYILLFDKYYNLKKEKQRTKEERKWKARNKKSLCFFLIIIVIFCFVSNSLIK